MEFKQLIENTKQNIIKEILVEKPCKVTKVHSPYLVDVEYYDNNKTDYICNVPVKNLQTTGAFVYLALKEGDYGTIRFFDNDITAYIKSFDEVTYPENRQHNINDNLFSIGFYPNNAQYELPSGDVVIGTTSGALISINGKNININGGNITISGSSIDINSDVKIDGKNFLEHTHSNGNEGSPTGGVI